MAKSNTEQKPTLMPPPNVQKNSAFTGRTTPMENISIAAVETKKQKNGSGKGLLSPSMPPPDTAKLGEAAKAGEAAVSYVTAWSEAATISALWSINQDKNAWFFDAVLGWKKLSTASDSGNAALTILSSHAKQKGSTVYYRTEDDGMVHEMYVW